MRTGTFYEFFHTSYAEHKLLSTANLFAAFVRTLYTNETKKKFSWFPLYFGVFWFMLVVLHIHSSIQSSGCVFWLVTYRQRWPAWVCTQKRLCSMKPNVYSVIGSPANNTRTHSTAFYIRCTAIYLMRIDQIIILYRMVRSRPICDMFHAPIGPILLSEALPFAVSSIT